MPQNAPKMRMIVAYPYGSTFTESESWCIWRRFVGLDYIDSRMTLDSVADHFMWYLKLMR